MSIKKVLQVLVLVAVVFTALGAPGSASAWYCNSYITVQWGDTLSGIAAQCGTTAYAIRAANPGLGWWVYAGQVLYIPTGSSDPVYYPPAPSYGSTYVVQWGDTFAKIAAWHGISYSNLLAANPQVYNPSWIYAGQVLNIPTYSYTPVYHTVQWGQTLKSIAAYSGPSVYSIQSLNPSIYNSNWIYAGQVIQVR